MNPSDYEECGECGFDHDYEYPEAYRTHSQLMKEEDMAKQSKADKAIDDQINKAYLMSCEGVQVSMMDIPKVFDVGRKSIAEGKSFTQLKEDIRAFVDTIRKN